MGGGGRGARGRGVLGRGAGRGAGGGGGGGAGRGGGACRVGAAVVVGEGVWKGGWVECVLLLVLLEEGVLVLVRLLLLVAVVERGIQRRVIAIETKIQLPNTLPVNCVIGIFN